MFRHQVGRLIVAAAFAIGCGRGLQAQDLLRLPDGEVTRSAGMTAYLVDPTTRYGHGVLGDATEAGGFVVERDGQRLLFRLGADAVFEDRRVRLADLDGDGQPEAIVVKAYLDRGAALAVYRIGRHAIEPLAEGPAIGQRNRWLNPVGVADFTGSGQAMLAAVVTPHLAGSLRLYRLAGAALVEVSRIDGFTNHRLGERDLDLARIGDIDGDGTPDIVMPSLSRQDLAAIGFKGGRAVVLGKASVKQRIARFPALRGPRATIETDTGERLDVIIGRD
ncbi:MAG TPA: hypothetical protein VGV17_06685 [Bosea sp. (in: a-proteobacteria)]|jgi:hypothetical protein|uniref:hypothetical protein n=1 Tax=Bosea sp. (in: a-proteobacteria) TaxID=1871050 RepID=UPI002DDD3FF0|nr:hypothetical protein [Bosea sp. (in: a-proteobacteria)]HEV2553424.1 hypothetical protein [Bosea sp. (in: a-proteobacteria)]